MFGGLVAYASRRAVSRVVSTSPAVGMTADAARLEARATKAIDQNRLSFRGGVTPDFSQTPISVNTE
jgi:hypothetical protein